MSFGDYEKWPNFICKTTGRKYFFYKQIRLTSEYRLPSYQAVVYGKHEVVVFNVYLPCGSLALLVSGCEPLNA